MNIEAGISVLILVFVLVGAAYDVELSREGRALHSRKYRCVFVCAVVVLCTLTLALDCLRYADGGGCRIGSPWEWRTQRSTWRGTMSRRAMCRRSATSSSSLRPSWAGTYLQPLRSARV